MVVSPSRLVKYDGYYNMANWENYGLDLESTNIDYSLLENEIVELNLAYTCKGVLVAATSSK